VAARKDPPFCAASPAVLHALNTGILCDGLRPVDIDIDDPALALRVRNVALEMLGDTIIRTRANSGRCLLTYRAVYGSPRKRVLTGCLGKIEILGHGQQFVALGIHPTGVDLRWIPVPPQEMAIDNLPAVTEKQITEFFRAVGPLIEAVPPGEEQQHNGQDHVSGEPQADPLRIAAALSDIPNDGPADWEGWNKVGMAVWRATGGSQAGWEAFNAWSARNSTYDPQETRERWDHYTHSPPTAIGAGTIFHMADAAKSPIGMFGRSNAGRHTSRRGTPRSGGDEQPETPRGWAQPLDFFADTEAAAPELRAEHLPPALWPFVQDASARMGVDPTSVAMACLVSCASVMTDDWSIQPKRFDTTWTENPRLWAAIVGDPSILKTPVIAACTKPIDRLDAEARQVHQDEMRAYQAALDDSNPRARRPSRRARRWHVTSLKAPSSRRCLKSYGMITRRCKRHRPRRCCLGTTR